MNYNKNEDKFVSQIGGIVSDVTGQVDGMNGILQNFQDNDNNLNAKIGDLSNLKTTIKTDLVSTINEQHEQIENLGTKNTVVIPKNEIIENMTLYKKNGVVFCSAAINSSPPATDKTIIIDLPSDFLPAGGQAREYISKGATNGQITITNSKELKCSGDFPPSQFFSFCWITV